MTSRIPIWIWGLLLWAGPVTASEIVLAEGQSLEAVARQVFDDPTAAGEIRALNGWAADVLPKPGTKVRLPGPERNQALTALKAAAQAIAQAKKDQAPKHAAAIFATARARLESAEQARRMARYRECRRLADETWALARQARDNSLAQVSAKNRFTVSVDQKGTTRVQVTQGDGVKVSAGKKSTTVKRGQAVTVKTGQPPEPVRPLFPAPRQVLPLEGSALLTASIYFSWKPVPGARGYLLVISKDSQGRQPVKRIQCAKPSTLWQAELGDGNYYWSLKSLDPQGQAGKRSPSRRFVLKAGSQPTLPVAPVPAPRPKEDGGKP